MSSNFYVYILKCSDGTYYTGHTDDLEKRIYQHQTGSIKGYTCLRRPVELVYKKLFSNRVDAFEAEMKIKNWSRKKKEALIIGDWKEISRLACKKKETLK